MSGNGHLEPANRPRGLAGVALRCQPDSRLVSLARGGYREAFEEIARRYGANLTSFAGSIVPAHRAEDVVQEALIKAYRALPRSNADLNLRAWLYTIVRNTALNDLRDERVHEHLDENWDGVPQPAEVAARRAELAVLFQRIKGLPPQQREALVRRELEGRSHEEIAAAIGGSPGAVRALIFRARSALRDGAGLLIPLPVLRALMDAGPVEPASGGAGLGGAAATLTAGGGGAALKAGGAVVVGVLAIGSGIAIHDRNHFHHDPAVTIAEQRDHAGKSGVGGLDGGAGRSDVSGASDREGPGAGGGPASGESNRGPGGDRGPGGASSPSDSSGDGGPGPGGGGGHDSSGPVSGDGQRSGGVGGSDDGVSGGGGDGGHSGSGSGGGGTSGGDEGSGGVSGHDGGTSGGGGGETTADVDTVSGDGGGGDTGDGDATTSSGSGSDSGSGSGDASSGLTD